MPLQFRHAGPDAADSVLANMRKAGKGKVPAFGVRGKVNLPLHGKENFTLAVRRFLHSTVSGYSAPKIHPDR